MKRLQAFCITLERREDRRKEFLSAWNRYIDSSQIALQFILAVEPPSAFTGPGSMPFRDLACGISHRKAIALAAARQQDVVLVLEDDALPVEERSLLKFMDTVLTAYGEAWHTVNLGGCNAQWRPATPKLRASQVAQDLFLVKGMVTTHAVLYHERSYADILCSVPTEVEFANFAGMLINPRPYDQWLAGYGTMLTGRYPLFVQSGSSSDILGVPHGTSITDLINGTYDSIRNACPPGGIVAANDS